VLRGGVAKSPVPPLKPMCSGDVESPSGAEAVSGGRGGGQTLLGDSGDAIELTR
jgi:hypothetical protein